MKCLIHKNPYFIAFQMFMSFLKLLYLILIIVHRNKLKILVLYEEHCIIFSTHVNGHKNVRRKSNSNDHNLQFNTLLKASLNL